MVGTYACFWSERQRFVGNFNRTTRTGCPKKCIVVHIDGQWSRVETLGVEPYCDVIGADSCSHEEFVRYEWGVLYCLERDIIGVNVCSY